MKKRGTSRDIWKKKRWYPILASKLFNEVEIGETPSLDEKIVVGRTVDTTVAELTGDGRKGHMKVWFKINKIEGEKARTEMIKFNLSRSYERSIMRRRTTKVGSILDVKTKDNKTVRIKPMVLTFKKCTSTQTYSIRSKLKEEIEKHASENTFDALVLSVISEKIQRAVKDEIKPIYPLKSVEIGSVALLD